MANAEAPEVGPGYHRLTLGNSWEPLPSYISKTVLCPNSCTPSFSEFWSPLAHPTQHIKGLMVSIYITSCPSCLLPAFFREAGPEHFPISVRGTQNYMMTYFSTSHKLPLCTWGCSGACLCSDPAFFSAHPQICG